MKVVLCVCLVALVETAPTIIENVQQPEYIQAGAYNQPLAYNQPQDYRHLDNQARLYSQPLDYNQQRAYNPTMDSQARAYNQAPDFSQLRIVNQPLDYNQLVDYGQRLDYDQRLDYLRGRRSNQVAVVSPCAAAAMQAHYPYHGYGYASPYYPYPRVYRADEEQEMSFSDGDQVEMARSYEAPPGLAYGVFPNAKTTGCGVPLLVSCSPNVVQGRLVKTEPHSYSAGIYRNQIDHQDAAHEHQDAAHDHQDVHEAKTQ